MWRLYLTLLISGLLLVQFSTAAQAVPCASTTWYYALPSGQDEMICCTRAAPPEAALPDQPQQSQRQPEASDSGTATLAVNAECRARSEMTALEILSLNQPPLGATCVTYTVPEFDVCTCRTTCRNNTVSCEAACPAGPSGLYEPETTESNLFLGKSFLMGIERTSCGISQCDSVLFD